MASHNLVGFNPGPTTFVNHFGIEFPAQTDRIFAALTIAKKWEMFKERGESPNTPPGDCFELALRALLPSIKMSPWTQDMLHDFVNHSYSAFIGCGACGKSFALSAAALGFWITDPLTTTVVCCSATLADLRTRCWSPLLKLFAELKGNKYFEIPGKSVNNIYSIINEKDDRIAETMTPLAGIHGRSLDEGRLFGLHNEFVAAFVDEMGLVDNIEDLKTAFSNIRIGTKVFKCCSAANPLPWSAPQSQFYLPKPGEVVTPDTGSWTSQMGYFVRHFDGVKSPVVLDPSLKSKYPFLMSREDVDSVLSMCNGDERHPTFFKMVRGFPLDAGTAVPTVLDPLVAAANMVGQAPDPIPQGSRVREIGLAAGVDPAWSSGGDSATYAGVRVYECDGRVTLDFTGRVSRLPISIDSPHPVSRQLRDGVLSRMRADGGPTVANIYVDSSGNQSLADFIDVYIGPGCGHINNSARAGDTPIRNLDTRPAKEVVRDRGAEGWVTLSAYCAAGMVRGLPQAAIDGLTQRRFALRPNSDEPCTPLRLEPKSEFFLRFKKSPDDTDACALAALAVKERLGVVPFGKAPVPEASALFPGMRQEAQQFISTEAPPESVFETDFSEVGAYD